MVCVSAVLHTYLENLGNALKAQNVPENGFFLRMKPLLSHTLDEQRNPRLELLSSSTAAPGTHQGWSLGFTAGPVSP